MEALPLMFNEETSGRVLAGRPDFVLDCIDNIDTKARGGAALAGHSMGNVAHDTGHSMRVARR